MAIKRLKLELVAENPELVKRLIREGEALRRLNHPNIVQILAMVEDEAQPLIVMEYVSGGSLRNLLDNESPLPLNRVLDLSLEVADAPHSRPSSGHSPPRHQAGQYLIG